MSSNQGALDLDALEKIFERWQVGNYRPEIAGGGLALIQRVREAEAHAAVGAEFDDCLDENHRLRTRIAQLERVREAASRVIEGVPDQEFVTLLWPAIADLRAALDAAK